MDHITPLRTSLIAALLMGCSGTSIPDPGVTPTDEPDPTKLSAIPADALGCGETPDTGFPCCVEAYCYTPSGTTECPATPDAAAMTSWGLNNLGSGICSCAEMKGPYSNEGTGKTGDCCYTMGVVGCEGRPMLVHGLARMAPLVSGESWLPDAAA